MDKGSVKREVKREAESGEICEGEDEKEQRRELNIDIQRRGER